MRKLMVASVLLTSMTLPMTGCICVEVHKSTDAPSNCCAMEKRIKELESRVTKLQETMNAVQAQIQKTQAQQEPVTK